ncbi:MAG: hypothetical protein Q8P12_07695 [bacterium]|nr:hypothetical protein [bacterium]
MIDSMERILERVRGGEERTLETFTHRGETVPFKTLFFREGKWWIRKVKSVDGDVRYEEIDILHDEAVQAVRDYLARERGKQKKGETT